MLKTAIKKTIDAMGYKISRKSDVPSGFSKPFDIALSTLLSVQNQLRIVQIGANDGSVGDPLYKFVRAFADRIDILLIEPQSMLIPFLEENYAFHPSRKIFNGAIGNTGTLILYAVDPAFWDRLRVPYARHWPRYAAASCITSSSRDHVANWLLRHLDDKKLIDKAIVETVVRSTPLLPLLAEMHCDPEIDVLQVDIEGFDDEAIYSCAVEQTKPILINFERKHLSAGRFDRLRMYLEGLGYVLSHNESDSLAIMTHQIRGKKVKSRCN